MFNVRMPFFNAEGAAAGGGNEPQSQPSAQPTFQGTPNWGMPNQGQPAAAPTPTPTPVPTPTPAATPPAQTEMLDFAGRKIPVLDPALKDLHKDFTSLNSTYTKTNQELIEARAQMQVYQQMLAQQQAQPPQPQTPSPEDLEQAKEEFMTRFYEDPLSAIEELVSKKVNPVVEPITKEREFNQEVQRISSKYADFNQMVPLMESVLQEHPQLKNQGLEAVYLIAKGKAAQNAVPAPTPEQLLSDPQFVQNYVMNNEAIRNQMISQYVNDKQATNGQIPVVLGNQAGGSIPSMPDNKPKTLAEASRAFAKHLGL